MLQRHSSVPLGPAKDQAAELARQMIAAFESANVETIVINAAGCGSTMKEYGHILRDDPVWAARAATFSAKCKDISEILCDLPAMAPRHPFRCVWPITMLVIFVMLRVSMNNRVPAALCDSRA